MDGYYATEKADQVPQFLASEGGGGVSLSWIIPSRVTVTGSVGPREEGDLCSCIGRCAEKMVASNQSQ